MSTNFCTKLGKAVAIKKTKKAKPRNKSNLYRFSFKNKRAFGF